MPRVHSPRGDGQQKAGSREPAWSPKRSGEKRECGLSLG
jgi:hypothetical protein